MNYYILLIKFLGYFYRTEYGIVYNRNSVFFRLNIDINRVVLHPLVDTNLIIVLNNLVRNLVIQNYPFYSFQEDIYPLTIKFSA